jgi:hypothetical protein
MSKDVTPATEGELLIYLANEGPGGLRVLLVGETVRLPQRQITDLYEVSVKTVSEHLQNVYEEGEHQPERTIRKFRIVQTEGERSVRREVDHYSLEAILAVGYRVRSARGTEFRAEQRRLEAEQAAEARYPEELRRAADALKPKRVKKSFTKTRKPPHSGDDA